MGPVAAARGFEKKQVTAKAEVIFKDVGTVVSGDWTHGEEFEPGAGR
ncbi:hypothetical protein SAMN05444955_11128 [Lihuaxuella thermophila]|uniref:Uncharacterized protein n=1 Tax=Lihuaxuella thermophila TaxID=1173111 RepID=A0A1H8GEU8_9BACL|nr:hypothetical protein SAMN05444955_11128 [Lihuaxuella thermophila]